MRRLTHPTLRVRLTLAFAGVASIVLAAVSVFVYLEVKGGLDASLDASLQEDAAQLAARDDASLRRSLAVEGAPAQLLDTTGRVLAASPAAQGRPLATPAQVRAAARGEVRYEREETYRRLARPAGAGRVIVVQASMVQRERALETLGGVLLIGGPLVVLLTSTACYLVAAGALRPVDRMRRRAATISAATPSARLPIPTTDDELRRLGETLNEMLGRLDAGAAAQRALLANASHELRTPLAILKAEVDLALAGPHDARLMRGALVSVGEEVDRLVGLAQDLLVLVRADEGALALKPERLEVEAVARRAADRVAMRGLVEVEVEPGSVVVADPTHLDRALLNLLDNALSHGAPPVRITAERRGGHVRIHVTDEGDGVAPAVLSRAFDRLASGPASRGSGLGLPIVAAIATAQEGTAGLRNRGHGADAWIELPA